MSRWGRRARLLGDHGQRHRRRQRAHNEGAPMTWAKRTMTLTIGLGFALASALELARPAWAQAGSSGPTLLVTDQSVTAAGMTPGGAVVWLGMARRVAEYEATFVRRHGTMQADAQGQAQLPLTEAVPLQSVWAAVDLKTGAYATASPAGFAPLALQLGPGALEVRGAGLADRLAGVARYAEVPLVRPGQGALGQGVRPGDVDNINLFNGALTVALPIGSRFPVNGNFSYQLTLVANSNPWDFSTRDDGVTVWNDSAPSHCSNAGLGWRVSFGALGLATNPSPPTCAPTDVDTPAGTIYEAPDGS